MPGLRDNGGCFTAVDGKIRFVPTTEVSVGFEYRIRYTTDHRILDRKRLAGFDAVYLGPGAGVSCTLANRYEDRRAAVAPGRSYRAVVFAHAAGAEYRLTCTRDGVAGRLWAEFAERTAAVATPAAGTTTDPVLEVRSGGAWVVYGGDWALYDGHVGERGRTVVELRVRTAAQRCSPASPARFDLIHFSGAEPGMTLTLHKECSVRSCFAAGPGYGAALSFADVARHGIRQSELLAALAHLFDLRFRTDEELRCVEVEPAAEFFDGPEADWRAKSDFAQPVVLSDIASEVHERRVWGYREGDGAVRRLDAEAGETSSGTGAAGPLGEWAFEVASCAAKEGTQRVRNPLFAPSASEEGGYRNAPSARILRVGDRDAATPEPLVPRIVRYAGMHPLPEGERWGAPWLGASLSAGGLPLRGRCRGGSPFTLCFRGTATAPRGSTASTTAAWRRRPRAGASPSRCGSSRTSTRPFSPRAPGPPASAPCSVSTRAGAPSQPRSRASTATTPRRRRCAVSSPFCPGSAHDAPRTIARRGAARRGGRGRPRGAARTVARRGPDRPAGLRAAGDPPRGRGLDPPRHAPLRGDGPRRRPLQLLLRKGARHFHRKDKT